MVTWQRPLVPQHRVVRLQVPQSSYAQLTGVNEYGGEERLWQTGDAPVVQLEAEIHRVL
jgi:hypothetical protein